MSAFTSAAQEDSCRATKKFLQNFQKDLPLLDVTSQDFGVGQAGCIQCTRLKRLFLGASWPSGDPDTIYDSKPIPYRLRAPRSSL